MKTNSTIDDKTITMEAPILIIFAEFLGYVSPLVDDAENWCNGKVLSAAIQQILIIEAKAIHQQMIKDFKKEELQFYYNSYHNLFIKPYEEKLQALLASE